MRKRPAQQISHRVNQERVKFLFSRLRVALISSLVLATIVASVLGVDRPGIALWYGIQVVIALMRLALARQFTKRPPEKDDLGLWTKGYLFGAFTAGIAWAAVLPLALDSTSLNSATVFTCMVLAGVVAGALPSMSASVGAYMAFTVPILAAVLTWSLFVATPALPSLALLGILYLVVMVLAVRQFNHLLIHGLKLALDKIDLLEQVESDHKSLQNVQNVILREHELAAHVMDSLIKSHVCEDCGIRRHNQPLHDFEGDIFLFGFANNGAARLLLGDATGHGLSAALAAIPVAQTFSAVNRKGLAANTLITELNRNLHRMLPSSMFVAAALLELRSNGNGGCQVQVWNGGLDDLLVRRADGAIRRLPARNLALGILDNDAFSAEFESVELGPDDQLYAYSDGITEAEDTVGRLFTRDRLEQVLSSRTGAERISAVMDAVTGFCGSAPLRDDLTILEIHSGILANSLDQRSSERRVDTLLAAS